MPPSTGAPSTKTELRSSVGFWLFGADYAPWYGFPMLSGRRRGPNGSLCAAVAFACSVWLGSATGHAQSTSDDLARRHFDSGVAYLEESDYDNALKAFQKAYDLSKRPEILLNVATVHERQSDLSSAVAALKAYLEA